MSIFLQTARDCRWSEEDQKVWVEKLRRDVFLRCFFFRRSFSRAVFSRVRSCAAVYLPVRLS